MKKSKFLFIHIAKTGGATIRRMLNHQGMESEYDCLHNNTLIINKKPTIQRVPVGDEFDYEHYQFIVYFVRNPYERLLSCYNYFYSGGLNQYAGNHFKGDERLKKILHEQFPTFEHCCRKLEAFSKVVPHARQMSLTLPPTSFQGSFFQGRYESFAEDILRLFTRLGIAVSEKDILRVNVSDNYMHFRGREHLKPLVYGFYRDDFERFGYAK